MNSVTWIIIHVPLFTCNGTEDVGKRRRDGEVYLVSKELLVQEVNVKRVAMFVEESMLLLLLLVLEKEETGMVVTIYLLELLPLLLLYRNKKQLMEREKYGGSDEGIGGWRWLWGKKKPSTGREKEVGRRERDSCSGSFWCEVVDWWL